VSVEIRVPQLPESVADATLAAWHKQIGQSVHRDENLGDLETDKVMLEIPAPINGVLREIKVQPGTTVKSGAVLALMEESTAAPASGPSPAAAATATPALSAPAAPSPPSKAAPRMGPAARRMLQEGKISASPQTGAPEPRPQASPQPAAPAAKTEPAQASAPPSPAASAPASASASAAASPGRAEQRVPMSRLRARIAERLLQAQASQALLTTFNEVDLAAVQALRNRHKDDFEKRHGVKLGLMSFFVKASIAALRRFPVVNAAVDGGDIVYHDYFDIGVAVSTDRGLMVPVLRDAEAMSYAEIEQRIAQYASRAREGSIKLEDLAGGTFSITNGGIFGSLMSTPIVNTPQSAILGMHKIQERAVVVNGEVVVRPMMYVALTYDHRIIDGREAVQFLVAVKDALEDPGRLLLGI
jgi:2-oxoglutarate dehydrogenase E2 component (dihydrolipoamide succinyltransferase)